MRQLDRALNHISKRVHNEFALNARLHGANIPLLTEKPEIQFSKDDDDKFHKAMLDAQERKRQEMVNKRIG